MKLDDIKSGLTNLRSSVAEGWQRLSESTSEALTRFMPTTTNAIPATATADIQADQPSTGWAMLPRNVFESENSVTVRLEIPGLEKENTRIEVIGKTLLVSGEKRFENQHSEGRYHVFQCAYGSFQRSLRLPVAVLTEKAKASYLKGILEIELPKAQPSRPKVVEVKIA